MLRGATRGYRQHPQLERFRAQADPLAAIASYLVAVADEAATRGYRFDRSKIGRQRLTTRIPETRGQLDFEWRHLRAKLRQRDRARLRAQQEIARPRPHPLFRVVAGGVRAWERAARPAAPAG